MGKSLPINKSSRCAVIGHGSWATAIVKVLTMEDKHVGWYVRSTEVLESLRSEGHNCRYLSDLEFDMNRIRLSDDLNATVSDADIIFLVTPAAYLKCYLSDLQVSLKEKIVVSAVKGIIPDENQFVTDYLKEHYGLSSSQLCFICGPTHAEEVGHSQLTYLTLACRTISNARIVGEKLKTPFIKVGYLRDINYLERSSVLKNIYAVMVGIAVGMGYGDNFISVLVSNCIKEMYYLLDPPHQVLSFQLLWRSFGIVLFESQPQPSVGHVDRPWQHGEDRLERDDDGGRGLFCLPIGDYLYGGAKETDACR